MHEHHEFRNDAFYLIRHIYLIAVELNTVLADIDIVFDFREIKYSCKIEGIIHIQVYPEHGIFFSRTQFMIKLEIILVREFRRLLCPERFRGIDNIVFVGVHIFAVFPFLDFPADDRNRQEPAIFLKQSVYASLFQKLLVVIVYIKNDIGSSRCFLCFLHFEFRTPVACPFHSFCTFFVRKRADNYFL